jgi:hypothetical protein
VAILREEKKMTALRIVLLGSIVALVGLTPMANAAGATFNGAWSGTDPDDGSRLLILIGGAQTGLAHVTFVDQFASACGAPATGIGSGTISGSTLSAKLDIRCGGKPFAPDVPITLDLQGETLFLGDIPFSRPGSSP